MLSRAIAGVLAARLVLAPWAVAEPADAAAPIRNSAAAVTWKVAPRSDLAPSAAPKRRGPLPKGLKWTGIGLLLAGSMTTLTAALGNCGAHECDKGTGLAVGGAEVVAGSMLLAIADRHRLPPAPSLVVLSRGGAMIRQ